MSLSREQRLLGSEKYISGQRFNASDALRMMSNGRDPEHITVGMARKTLGRLIDQGLLNSFPCDDPIRPSLLYIRAKPDIDWKPSKNVDESCIPRWF